MPSPTELLKFRCTGCGNCCKEPLLPLTDADVRRISERTGESPTDFVRFIAPDDIDLDDEPEAFALLDSGRRVMVLRHQRGRCRYLDANDRCGIYGARPLGCRIFPFDPRFDHRGKLRRLKLIQAADCRYELDGDNDVDRLRRLHERYEQATASYQERVAAWNALQRQRRRAGKRVESARAFLRFLALLPPLPARGTKRPTPRGKPAARSS
ncbi:MAG TPA: YkgJ family cysteine cluster protein [Polyangiaceae bacterium]|nr:YkgJ family cysteine cluster protein [Polyangiaceae bacterium]